MTYAWDRGVMAWHGMGLDDGLGRQLKWRDGVHVDEYVRLWSWTHGACVYVCLCVCACVYVSCPCVCVYCHL